MSERYGWICCRCSASNSPDTQRCACSPVTVAPQAPVYPWVLYVPSIPTSPGWPLPPYITWTSSDANISACPLKGCYINGLHKHSEAP